MDLNKEKRSEQTGGSSNTPNTQGTGTTSGGLGSPGSREGQSTASAPQRAREGTSNLTQDVANRGAEAYEQAKHAVGTAYEKTSDVVNDAYSNAITYGREHPAQIALIAFGAGVGIGVLLASTGSRRGRASRIAEPVLDAISKVALEFVR